MNLREEMTEDREYCVVKIFLKEIYCTENSARYTRLQNCSFNQFAI